MVQSFSFPQEMAEAQLSACRRDQTFVTYAVVWPAIAWLALKCSLSGQISFVLLHVYPELDTDATP